MADQNGSNGGTAIAAAGAGDPSKEDSAVTPVSKKAKIDESGATSSAGPNVEEKDFDKETQKALEEIDANQNEIDALNERKEAVGGLEIYFCISC